MRCDDEWLDAGRLPPEVRWVVAKRDRDGWRWLPCETAEQARTVVATALRAHNRTRAPAVSPELAD